MTSTENIKKLYRSGASLRKISEAVGIPRETLRVKLISSGFKLRTSRRCMPVILHAPIVGMNSSSAELFAMHAGDGCLDRGGNWCFTADKNDVKLSRYVVKLSTDVIGVIPNISDDGRIRIRSGHKQFTEYFSKFFPLGKKSAKVILPQTIMKSKDLGVKRSALRGLFSTDGSFSFKKSDLSPRIEFRVISRGLRDQFVELGKAFDFEFNYSTQKHRNGHIYTAYIERRNEVIRWMSDVGSICDTHLIRYNDWNNLNKRGSHSLVA